MPPKKNLPSRPKQRKLGSRSSLTPSRQEILDRLPPPGDRIRPVKQMDKLIPVYVLYVILHTHLKMPAKIIMRRTFESQFEALEAFKMEYAMWTVGGKNSPYPSCHSQEQLSPYYLANILEMNKRKDADSDDDPHALKWPGRGKVEYALTHRDDQELEDDRRRRRCIIVCEETISEKM